MDFQNIQHFLDSLVEKGIVGNSCAILKDGQVVFEHYTGYADLEKQRKIGPDTLFRIYSMTKLFTCVAAMQLYEKGAFLLTDPVSNYLPEFSNMQVVHNKGNGATVLKNAENPIRIYDLFSMTAGLTYGGGGGDAARLQGESIRKLEESVDNYTTRDYIRALASAPLAFEPGSHFRYSLCHDVLGALIEEVSGERFSDYVENHICKPLGLKDTYFRCPTQVREERLANFYEIRPQGEHRKIISQDKAYEPGCRMDRGGAGLLSTLWDYVKFAETLNRGGISSDGVRILQESTVKLMATNRLNEVQRSELHDWVHARGYGYGLGMRVMVDPTHAGGGNIGEFGWSGMAGTWVMMDPEKKITAVYMEQSSPSLEPYIAPRLRNLIYASI